MLPLAALQVGPGPAPQQHAAVPGVPPTLGGPSPHHPLVACPDLPRHPHQETQAHCGATGKREAVLWVRVRSMEKYGATGTLSALAIYAARLLLCARGP